MVIPSSDEKTPDGTLLGLILLWNCTWCEFRNTTWLIRKEAAAGKKQASCTSCEGKNLVKFDSCDVMSDREKIIGQALPLIPVDEQNHLFEDLALIEALFSIEGCEGMAESFWHSVQRHINYWIEQDCSPRKK